MPLHPAQGTLAEFRGKLVLLTHRGSIFSKGGASAKPAAIQTALELKNT